MCVFKLDVSWLVSLGCAAEWLRSQEFKGLICFHLVNVLLNLCLGFMVAVPVQNYHFAGFLFKHPLYRYFFQKCRDGV